MFKKKNELKTPLEKESEELAKKLHGKILNWSDNATVKARKSSRLAWTIAVVSMVLNITLAYAIAALMPLKTLVPLPVAVNTLSGDIKPITSIELTSYKASEAIDRSLVHRYVRLREHYNWHTIEQDSEYIYSVTVGKERKRYLDSVSIDNPDSPVSVYGQDAEIKTHIKSISRINQSVDDEIKVYQVRFTNENDNTFKEGKGKGLQKIEHVVYISITYKLDQEMEEELRLANPLGFAVTKYVKEQEL